jgi:hypothetical protein
MFHIEEVLPVIVLEGLTIIRDTHTEQIDVKVVGQDVYIEDLDEVKPVVFCPDSLARIHQAMHRNGEEMQAVINHHMMAKGMPLFFHPEDASDEEREQEARWVTF